MADKIYIPQGNLVGMLSNLQKDVYIEYRHGSFCDGAYFQRIFDDDVLGEVLELQSNSGDTHYVPLCGFNSVVIRPNIRKRKDSDDSS